MYNSEAPDTADMDLLLLAKEGETYKSSAPKEKPKSIQERSKPTSYIK